MNRISVLLMMLITVSTLSFTPIESARYTSSSNAINWLSWDEAMQLSEQEPKKIFLDVYTDWCGWCKRMDQITFQQNHIAQYINDNYYAVRLDAEYKEDLVYKGNTYSYITKGKKGYHELAAELLKGRLSYPTVVFLDEEQNILQSIVGFKSPEEFEKIATYFAEDHYMETPWSIYQRTYKPVLAGDQH